MIFIWVVAWAKTMFPDLVWAKHAPATIKAFPFLLQKTSVSYHPGLSAAEAILTIASPRSYSTGRLAPAKLKTFLVHAPAAQDHIGFYITLKGMNSFYITSGHFHSVTSAPVIIWAPKSLAYRLNLVSV